MNSMFEPRRVSPAVVGVDNLLATRRISIDIPVAGQSITVSLQPSHLSRDYNMAFTVVVNQVSLTVLVDQEMLNAYLSLLSGEGIYADLPNALREGVGIRFWEEVIGGIAQVRGLPLTLQSVSLVQNFQEFDLSACLVVQFGDEQFYSRISVRSDLAPWLDQIFSTFPIMQRTPSSQTPVLVHFEKGRTLITRSELASVEPFDVILFDTVWQDLLVRAGPGRCFRASTQSAVSGEALGIGLTDSAQASSHSSSSTAIVRVAVSLEEVVEDVQNPDSSGDVSSVPVTLTFELDRQQVTLGDLMQIGPGYTFNLAANAQAPIQIRANGQCIGSAELVQIGDQKLGARVLALQNT